MKLFVIPIRPTKSSTNCGPETWISKRVIGIHLTLTVWKGKCDDFTGVGISYAGPLAVGKKKRFPLDLFTAMVSTFSNRFSASAPSNTNWKMPKQMIGVMFRPMAMPLEMLAVLAKVETAERIISYYSV